MHDDLIKWFLKILNNNKKLKDEELFIINNFENYYNFIYELSPQELSYKEIIDSPDSRLRFLASSVDVLTSSDLVGEDTYEVAFDMFLKLYTYFTQDSELKDLEIPTQIKDKMFVQIETKGKVNRTDLLIPTSNEVKFLMTLISENKRIYKEYFDGKDLSQTIGIGLHSNITELLSIEEKDISHMLGVNNESHHLFDFYRKTFLNNTIEAIKYKLKIDKSKTMSEEETERFSNMFEKIFGLSYSDENYNLLISLRYGDIDKLFEEGKINSEQVEKLRSCYDAAPKSKTIDFYSTKSAANKLAIECAQNADFVYEYVRKNIIVTKLKNKSDRNKILSKIDIPNFESSMLDFNINSNNADIRKMIDRYISEFGNNLKEDSTFQTKFKARFGYKYPLIDYYEILAKNVSFYNFSLMNNLNDIIVDFDDPNKSNVTDENDSRPDLYLVSYAKNKIAKLREKVNKGLKKQYKEDRETANSDDADLTDEYIAALRSLYAFPSDVEYYFEQGFACKLKSDRESALIKEIEYSGETKSNDVFSLMGFFTEKAERRRLEEIESFTEETIEHKHKFKTNITANFHKYITHYCKFGHVYPIGTVSSWDPVRKRIRILKMDKGPSNLLNYVEKFNEYQKNIYLGYQRSLEYEKYLIGRIKSIIDSYELLMDSKTRLLKHKKSKYIINKNDYYIDLINNQELSLQKFSLYVEKTKEYFDEFEKRFAMPNSGTLEETWDQPPKNGR